MPRVRARGSKERNRGRESLRVREDVVLSFSAPRSMVPMMCFMKLTGGERMVAVFTRSGREVRGGKREASHAFEGGARFVVCVGCWGSQTSHRGGRPRGGWRVMGVFCVVSKHVMFWRLFTGSRNVFGFTWG